MSCIRHHRSEKLSERHDSLYGPVRLSRDEGEDFVCCERSLTPRNISLADQDRHTGSVRLQD